MNSSFRYSLLILFAICSSQSLAQSKVLLELKDNQQIARQLYFYPSTLRMLNLDGNEAYYDLIRDIGKVIIFRMDNESFVEEDFDLVVQDLMKEEGFEEYMSVDGNSERIMVYGRNNPPNLVVLTHLDGTYYISEVQGTLDLWQLPKLYDALANQDSTTNGAFIDFFDISGFGPGKQNKGNKKESESEESPDTTQSRS